jgi:indolepyruvate ferredoxin oxidoreductase
VQPMETPLGRKRKIDQSSCNKDYSCAKGFCPSFVGVLGGQLRKKAGALAGGAGDFQRHVEALPRPAPHTWSAPYDLLVTGVGGTGVVTVGALITMAAHLEGKSASVLDFMGFAQKGGSVLSYVRMADVPARLNQVRIDTQQADAILACDLVVGASPDALVTVRHGRTRVLANTHEVPVAESLRNPDASLKVPQLLEKLRFAAGADRVETLDAQALAESFLGDSIYSNIVALGAAWQRGLVPVSLPAVQQAIRLNGVAVENNQLAFSLGRLAVGEPQALASLLTDSPAHDKEPADSLDAIVARGVALLTGYQSAAYAKRYADFVAAVRAREQALGADVSLPFTRAVARSLLKLMAYKDEYEVARLYTDGEFQRTLKQQFEGDIALEFYMAPPVISKARGGQAPRKVRLGGWMMPAMKLLAHGRRLRGTALDLFGRTEERRVERELIAAYRERIESLLPALAPDRLKAACDIAALPLSIRGFGHVKLANLALARAREAELLHKFDPKTYPRPAASREAGQIRGIRVTAAA